MTSPVSAVEAKPRRFSNDRNPNGLGYSNGVVEDDHGYYVLHSDYEALARQAEALQQENAEKDARIAALTKVVTPFARIADMTRRNAPGTPVTVNVDRCRDARTLLKEEANAGD